MDIKDIFSNILYNLSPSSIKRISSLNKNLYSIYNNEYFWSQYCRNNYFVISKHDKHSWKQIVFFCESILIKLFSKNIFPTDRSLQAIILIIGEDILSTEFLEVFCENFNISTYCLTNAIRDHFDKDTLLEYVDDILNVDLNLLSDKNFIQIISSTFHHCSKSDLLCVNKIIKIIHRPTIYFVPSFNDVNHLQHYTVKYDIDVLYKINNWTDHFLFDYEEMIYIKYFFDFMKS